MTGRKSAQIKADTNRIYVADYISLSSSLQIIIIIAIKLCCRARCRVAILIARLILILNKLDIGVIWKTLPSFDAILVTLGGNITAITLTQHPNI